MVFIRENQPFLGRFISKTNDADPGVALLFCYSCHTHNLFVIFPRFFPLSCTILGPLYHLEKLANRFLSVHRGRVFFASELFLKTPPYTYSIYFKTLLWRVLRQSGFPEYPQIIVYKELQLHLSSRKHYIAEARLGT